MRCAPVSTMPAGTTAFCSGKRIEERLRRDAEGRELGVAELDEDLLVLHAVEIDLGDARHLEKLLPQRLRDALQLRIVGAIAGQHVEDEIDVAVFVVDVRADEVGGQLGRRSSSFLRSW